MRILVRAVLAVLILAAVAATGFYFHLRGSLPQVTGEARLATLQKPAEVLRDAFGVPHIYAQSLEDAMRALGYVHAQDRLWQMEMNRRTAAGRLSEILGPGPLEIDKFLRTLGVRRAAEANLQKLDAPTRRLLDAYAEGVNAYLASAPVLPPEFWIARVKPEPWTPADSLGWIKMMAWDLARNWRSELLRMQLAKTLPNERINEFLPPYPGEKFPGMPELGKLYAGMEQEGVKVATAGADKSLLVVSGRERRPAGDNEIMERRIGAATNSGYGGLSPFIDLVISGRMLFPAGNHETLLTPPQADALFSPLAPTEGLGSNNWVVSGKKSATGAPLLANDPHLGLSAPVVWYFAHIKTPAFEAIGATLPGVPAIVL
ncbi:MAG TPA: penicillin acylase family protein, partial [Burkholderiales bacterium]|nr:penicillin acylase family protein [Burkholderiales bacterium]